MLVKDVAEKIWGPNFKARRIFFYFQKAGLFSPTYPSNITTAATRSTSDVNGGYGLAGSYCITYTIQYVNMFVFISW